ncbi:MAG: hypothetical protein FJ368_02865 [Pelagibacterales bacterium]|nr:hypothetical protein [Pelagibacterales bacterium]
MKKLLLILVLLASVSCSYKNQKIVFNFDVENENKSNSIEKKTFDLRVSDERHNKKILGKKKFGQTRVNVFSEQNLADILKYKIKDNLVNQGFIEGNDKIVEVRIKTLVYKAQRGFPIGTSEAKGVIRVDIKDSSGKNKEFSKNYTLEFKNKHFISSLSATDEKNINNLLHELVSDMMKDKELIDNISN